MIRIRLRSFLMLPLAALLVAAAPPARDDAFLDGYVTALLELDFAVSGARVEVDAGRVRIAAASLGPRERKQLRETISRMAGVTGVDFVTASAEDPLPAVSTSEPPEGGVVFLPEGELFDPLIADPRWPRFGASYQIYLDDDELTHVGAVSFGESIALLRGAFESAGRWELGFQAAVFSIFDLDAPSSDLVNSDFSVGLTASHRLGPFSAMARVFHQSSHLGDEFLLRNRVDRINVSYEAFELLASYELGSIARVYGGGGLLLRKDPSELERGSVQGGLEVTSPRAFWGGRLRPVAGVDVQGTEEGDWDPEVAVRAGLQIENMRRWTQRIRLMFEYYNGRSPNGQFFDRDIELIGVGAFLDF